MTTLSALEPKAIWNCFETICSIPHSSKHEAEIIRFVQQTGERLGLVTEMDDAENVLIRKPATPGYDHLKMVTLQSHLDMVPQKNRNHPHNFAVDPIIPVIDGDWVTATDTTLGADNGIGVATMLALLESTDIPHGPLECLFTVDEETGMTGAFGLKPNWLQGEILLNLDSEDEGELFIGCAGGVNTQVSFDCVTALAPAGHQAFTLSLTGFKGGHSGCDIHLERGNPIQEMARLLLSLMADCNAEVASISGGSLRNAIPREAFAEITVPTSKTTTLSSQINQFNAMLKAEFTRTAPDLEVAACPLETTPRVINATQINAILKGVCACPNGVLRMSSAMPGIVEASSNMGIIKTRDGGIEVFTLQRASHDSLRKLSSERVRHVFELAGGLVSHSGEYPGWVPDPDSEILGIMTAVYRDVFGHSPKALVIHAGLECGLIRSVYPAMEMISLGPTICFPHSPDEKVEIASVTKFWLFLKKILTSIPSA